jgi:GH15 family glucan-1,4-alpha-glucosidase
VDARVPIAGYGVVGDGNTAALVSPEGGIDWWCTPRFDSPSVFGRLLDPDAGHWAIRACPAGEHGPHETVDPLAATTGARPATTVTRRYLPGTLVLTTELRTASGAVELIDALSLGRAEPHRIGRDLAPTLVRRARGLHGAVDLAVALVPRFGYGRRPPRVRVPPGAGHVELTDPEGDGPVLHLTSDRPVTPARDGVRDQLRLEAGEQVHLALSTATPGSGPPGPGDLAGLLDDTVATWRRWSDAHDRYDGAYAGAVRRSSLLLQALTYQPTGALVAAATTSLPEVPGGTANWDYRYAWLRDAAMVLRAQWVGACPDEADRYFAWMADAVDGRAHAADGGDGADSGDGGDGADRRLQIVYDVAGRRDLPEAELDHLRGYAGHRPVRVGNDAWRQRQLDVPGEVLDAVWTLRDRLHGDRTAALVHRLADVAATTWTEPDAGIWEGREGERHYLSSKLMCWVALDRAIRLARGHDLGPVPSADVERWSAERESIRRTILADGWDDRAGAFTGALGSDRLDASALMLPLVGFLPASDPRVLSTVDAIETQLCDNGLVRRWTGAGGAPGSGSDEEGAFVMCSYWLAQCRALAGQVDRAAEVFEQVTGHANDLGVLAEMVDPHTGEQLGNVPQALSHAAQVCAAWTVDRATGADVAEPASFTDSPDALECRPREPRSDEPHPHHQED